jgi:hypothetical protein
MVNVKRALYGLFAAALAAAFCVVVINTLHAVLPGNALVFLMMTGFLGVIIMLSAFIPAMCFHFIAEVMRLRHPGAYMSAGAMTSIVLARMSIMPAGSAISDRAAVIAVASIAVSGCISGFVFWFITVRPLRRHALSPKSTG